MQPSRLLAGLALGSVLSAGTAWAQPEPPVTRGDPAPAPAASAASANPAPAAAPADRPDGQLERAAAMALSRQARKRRVKPAKFDVIATYPGFRMLEGGASRVELELSKAFPEITELRAEGRVTYRMQGVGAPISNNRRALLTSFFRTPVSRVQLVDGGEVLSTLAIDLAPSAFRHQVVESEGGGAPG